jgi:hypothetical protein
MKSAIHIILFGIMVSSVAYAESQAVFKLPSGVDVKIIEDNFSSSDFKIEGCTDTDSYCLINGKLPYGTAFGLPKTYLKSISISYKGCSYELNTSDMYNAWGARPLKYKDVIRYFGGNCYDKDNCQFRGIFSDAAGSYVAEWEIINGKSYRTVLTNSGDIMDLFLKNIDPPTYE